MNGSPAKMGRISGTAGHSSALKMRAEQNAASALKQNPYADAKKKDPKLDEYIGVQGKTTPGSEEYEANQAKINAAYGKERDQKLKAAQIAKNPEKKKEVVVKTKEEIASEKAALAEENRVKGKNATERKPNTKRDSLLGDENKDGNMLTRRLAKAKANRAKNKETRLQKQRGKNEGGVTNAEKRANKRAATTKRKDKEEKQGKRGKKGTSSRGGNIFS